jgi:hypothetical protein
MLVEKINRHNQYFDTLVEGCSLLPDMATQEMCLFLSITEETGHDKKTQ